LIIIVALIAHCRGADARIADALAAAVIVSGVLTDELIKFCVRFSQIRKFVSGSQYEGAVYLSATGWPAPGMKSFFLIGGRYFADGDHYADVTGALPALKQDMDIKYAWHNWPHRTEINETDVFAGFSEAYSSCLKFLRGEASS
jgi:hypothetical protein